MSEPNPPYPDAADFNEVIFRPHGPARWFMIIFLSVWSTIWGVIGGLFLYWIIAERLPVWLADLFRGPVNWHEVLPAAVLLPLFVWLYLLFFWAGLVALCEMIFGRERITFSPTSLTLETWRRPASQPQERLQIPRADIVALRRSREGALFILEARDQFLHLAKYAKRQEVNALEEALSKTWKLPLNAGIPVVGKLLRRWTEQVATDGKAVLVFGIEDRKGGRIFIRWMIAASIVLSIYLFTFPGWESPNFFWGGAALLAAFGFYRWSKWLESREHEELTLENGKICRRRWTGVGYHEIACYQALELSESDGEDGIRSFLSALPSDLEASCGAKPFPLNLSDRDFWPTHAFAAWLVNRTGIPLVDLSPPEAKAVLHGHS